MPEVRNSSTRPLAEMLPGTSARIISVNAPDTQTTRLEGLGICEGRIVRIVKRGDPWIVQVYGARIGLSPWFMDHIDVLPVEAD